MACKLPDDKELGSTDVIWGHNTLLCSGYENGQMLVADAYKRWAQIIFSNEFIACPQV